MLITRRSRDKYKFSSDFFRADGHLLFANLSAARSFAGHMSVGRAQPLPAADLYALSLMDEAFHVLFEHYREVHAGVFEQTISQLQADANGGYASMLFKFLQEFPPHSIYQGEKTATEYLAAISASDHGSDPSLEVAALRDILLIENSNRNPALVPWIELFDRSVMGGRPYERFVDRLQGLLSTLPPTGTREGIFDEPLIEIFQAPVKASPNSIEGQLKYLLERWGHLLGEGFRIRLLRGLDYIREEVIRRHGPGSFTPAAEVHTFTSQDYAEYERYSADQVWMPRLVLIAKNTYVWLDQLSRKYGHEIRTLDQIPDEELELLAARGFSGLWLIGLWERSRASQRIKQRMGQQEAVASAYSLFAYDIASDLGGWDALQNLRARAWMRGIRLSADMVPNHMGIDSTWVIEHPDWFLSLQHPPYPSYSFNSEDLSDDPQVGIHLEDHYYDRSDAAVVFQRRDHRSGEVRYIYHGNDGTSFPWNDTAQLDYSQAEVREAVIQTILHVARNFPVIRFDAAMTLAKKHIQRLWFPPPGTGGAIPSRSQFGMSRAEFDAAIPEEFWREVVDRVASEVPDTLLLAEAFWLMEGYFVRTLGMHRVYNSAFMHMLRDEDNAGYRNAIKNTLEFDPQILKRYVNFMNNPDERTAVEQFGTGDKYFGVATLLATLPGLPMFGHGQLEGFHEKYGMEYRHAKWDEQVDDGLVRGHEWRIFPLLHRRPLFADVEHFLLYDFFTARGHVNEDVFALSNRLEDERALVIYHNRYSEVRGWIRTSAASLDKQSGDLRQRSLAEGLGLPFDGYVIFRDQVTHLEYIRSCEELWSRGMYVELNAYQSHVFMDWRFVTDERWSEIHHVLNGAGVGSMQEQWDGMFPVQEASSEGSQTTGQKKRMVRGKKVVKGGKQAEKKKPDKSNSGKKAPAARGKTVKKPSAKSRKTEKKKTVKSKRPAVRKPKTEKKKKDTTR